MLIIIVYVLGNPKKNGLYINFISNSVEVLFSLWSLFGAGHFGVVIFLGRPFSIVKLQAKSLDQELTLFYPGHKKNKNKNNKKKNKNPHQNLSEGGVLEGQNLAHRLLIGFWLSLGGQGYEGPMSQEEQEEPHQNLQYQRILKI